MHTILGIIVGLGVFITLFMGIMFGIVGEFWKGFRYGLTIYGGVALLIILGLFIN